MPTRKTRTTRRSTPRNAKKSYSSRTRTSKPSRPWTREEVQFMRKFYRKFETVWCARQMGRTVYSVRYKAVDLGIKKASPSIWRGNKGAANSFKACCKPYGSKTTRKVTSRKANPRRSNAKRTYKASNRKYNRRNR